MSEFAAVLLVVSGVSCAVVAACVYAWWRRRVESPSEASRTESLSSDVLANVSHEIRTPLNGILGLTQLLLESSPTPQQREYLEMIKSSGGTLLRALNDILDYSSIQAGKLSLESEAFHTRRWVRQCIKTLAPQAHMKGIELAYWVRPEVPTLIASDPTRLRQVLVNLAVNAIKYTNEGHVLVELGFAESESDGDNDGDPRLRVSVSDTGIGISESFQREIFQAFKQAETGLPGESGLGLGLAISSQIVDRMGGCITVESELGRGSTFRFEVPVRRMEGIDEETVSAEALDGMRALVVDDSRVQREVLGHLLRHWGVEVTLAGDEADALEALDALGHGRYSLILIDSRIPGVDSFALAKRMQQEEQAASVLMTLAHEQVSAEALRSHGFVGQLTKPIAPVHLLRAIEIIRRGASVEKSSDVQSYTMDRLILGGLRLLVAEDNPVNRTVLVHSLERNGCEVELTDNGRDALRLATEQRFDALLLDLEMPELDGLSVCREIRNREAATGSHLAIVATTAHARGEDRERCLAVGMDAFVSKPYEEAELVAAIDSALKQGGRAKRNVFDRKRALDQANGDEKLLKELIELFLGEHPRTLQVVEEEIRGGHFVVAQRLAHRLKGALLTLGARSSAKRADELEETLTSKNDVLSRAAWERLRAEVDELLPVLRANLVTGDGDGDDASVSSEPGALPGSQSALSNRRSR